MTTSADPVRARWANTLAGARTWSPPDSRTVVVAPHPDDETLGCGALIAEQRRRGREVVVVALTDGDAAYDTDGDEALAARRRDEQRRALSALGVDWSDVVRLGLADGHVAEHEPAVADALADIVRPSDLLVAPWPRDHHPDHEAAGRAAAEAAERHSCDLLFWLFWTWHHTDPDDAFDPDVLRRLEASRWSLAAKERALACHLSQFPTADRPDAILDAALTEPATWGDEFFVAAANIGSAPEP